ncbi:MAG: hypothetical protein MUF87_16055 [Anaerolineae bacterium]|jgi:hypothetical protein|nr:hypothetical protein [Anaerolineae bacterium]
MSITLSRIEPEIYLAVYKGTITPDEFYLSFQELQQMIHISGDPWHVAIIDTSQLKQLPLDPQLIMQTIPKDRVGTIAVKSPMIAKVIGGIVAKLSKHPIYFYDSMDEAIQQAHALLRQKSA